MLGWISTGVVFLIKPGYEQAYEKLSVKTYPLDAPFSIQANRAWSEVRIFKTILGLHLLVQSKEGWQHVDPISYQFVKPPGDAVLLRLLNDAVAFNSQRYGVVKERQGILF